MTKKIVTVKEAIKNTILTSGELEKLGFPTVFRLQGIEKFELNGGTSVNIGQILELNRREVVVSDNGGMRQNISLSEIKFIHVTPALAEHLARK